MTFLNLAFSQRLLRQGAPQTTRTLQSKSRKLFQVGKQLGTTGASKFKDRLAVMETSGQRGSWAKLATLKPMAYRDN